METPGWRPAETSAETFGVKPAEDGHTPSLTNQTELTKRTPPWKVVYYGSAVILVVAVWTVALLPSVLTFSIVRSPVQVIYRYRLGYHSLCESTSWGDNSNPSSYKQGNYYTVQSTIWHICDMKQSVATKQSLCITIHVQSFLVHFLEGQCKQQYIYMGLWVRSDFCITIYRYSDYT